MPETVPGNMTKHLTFLQPMKRSEMLIFVLQTVKKIAIDALVEQNFDNDYDLFLIDDFDFDLKTFIFWRRTKKFFKRFRLKNVTDKNGNKLTFSLFICSLNKQFSKLGRAVIVAQLAERSLPTTGGPRFESSHQPLLLNHYIPFAVCRKGEK